MQMSIFSSEELLASPSLSQDNERDWTTRVVTWHSNMLSLLTGSVSAGFFGRTCPVSSQAKVEKTSRQSSRHLREEWLKSRPRDGRTAVSSHKPVPVTSVSPGECLTLNMQEYHSAAVASSLSDILETGDVPQRFFLSPTACKGIMRRAEKRGKPLPPSLRAALEVVGSAQTSTVMEDSSQAEGVGGMEEM